MISDDLGFFYEYKTSMNKIFIFIIAKLKQFCDQKINNHILSILKYRKSYLPEVVKWANWVSRISDLLFVFLLAYFEVQKKIESGKGLLRWYFKKAVEKWKCEWQS